MVIGNAIYRHIADVVAVHRVFGPRITKTDN